MIVKTHRIILIVALLFAFALPSSAQEVAPYQINEKYDRFEDRTTVTLRDIKVAGTTYESLIIGAIFAFSGTKVTSRPEKIAITAVSMVKGYNFMESTNLVFITDGVRLPLGSMNRISREELIKGMVQAEGLMAFISYDEFMKIAKAKSVEARLGEVEFTLTAKQLKGFTEFAKKMTPK